jgi:phage host-nuclease inhibitor protein Gam
MSKAKKARKTRTPAAPVAVPQDDGEADAMIFAIGAAQRELARIATEMGEELAAIKVRYQGHASRHIELLEAHAQGLAIYCAANRKRLTDEGRIKTHRFGNGEVSWRSRPASVQLKAKVEAVLKAIKDQALECFIRRSEEIDREAMLKNPDLCATLPVKIGSAGEDFIVKPFATEIEAVREAA